MQSGGKKVIKTEKTKFRKNQEDHEDKKKFKNRHHDKSYYRLAKQEKEEYVL